MKRYTKLDRITDLYLLGVFICVCNCKHRPTLSKDYFLPRVVMNNGAKRRREVFAYDTCKHIVDTCKRVVLGKGVQYDGSWQMVR